MPLPDAARPSLQTVAHLRSRNPQLRTLALLLIILAVGGAARYYRLGEIPRGLYADEAADGNDAMRAAAQHDFRVFYRDNAGREGLWVNLMAFSVARFGPTPFAVRFWAPLTGLLTIVFLYLLAARWFGERVGLLAAWFLATSFWHLDLSRYAVRGLLVPLLLTAAIYFLQRSWDARGARAITWAVIGGVLYGLGFHSYIAFRVTPLLIAVFVILSWRSAAAPGPRLAQTVSAWLVAAFLTALPIGMYFLHNPQDFFSRSSQVSVWSDAQPATALARSVIRTLLMFNFRGDCNWRHNLPCAPELILPVGLFFLGGLWVAFRESRRDGNQRAAFWTLLVWLFLLLAPAFLTVEAIPHTLRSIGALPAAVLLAALGADRALTRWAGRRPLFATVAAILVVSGAIDLYRYFFVWARSPQLDDAFQYSELQAAERMRALPPATQLLVFVDEPTSDWRPTGFMHVNPDGLAVLLPEKAQIPIFITGNRPNTTYLLSSRTAGADLQALNCEAGVLPPPEALTPLAPVPIAGCDRSLVLLRLPQ